MFWVAGTTVFLGKAPGVTESYGVGSGSGMLDMRFCPVDAQRPVRTLAPRQRISRTVLQLGGESRHMVRSRWIDLTNRAQLGSYQGYGADSMSTVNDRDGGTPSLNPAFSVEDWGCGSKDAISSRAAADTVDEPDGGQDMSITVHIKGAVAEQVGFYRLSTGVRRALS